MREDERMVADWAASRAQTLGLRPGSIEAAYIANPGGFVNRSYRVTDGDKRIHVKLAPKGKIERLKQWEYVGQYLTAHYTAPAIVDIIAQEMMPGYPYGIAFEYADGKPLAGRPDAGAVVPRVMRTIARLHADRELAERLRARTPPPRQTYADAFADVYISRFEEDLDVIEAERERLDFVSDGTIAWMREETDRLREAVMTSTAFRGEARDVAHNDLNGHNVLADDEGAFRIIDWDDLTACGDAAVDYSILLWPLRQTPGWTELGDLVRTLAGDETAERLALYDRAKLLDDVIDTLADYIEAEAYPDEKAEARRRARAIHLDAYARYTAQYND